MSTWLDLTIDERQTILHNVSETTAIIENAVEKDWWVTMILQALFQSSCADFLVFKGGTSLSKGWNLIQRFSEDIDLAIDRTFFGFDGKLSKKERTVLRKSSLRFIREELAPELETILHKMDIRDFHVLLPETQESDKDPEIIFIPYVTVLEESEHYIPFQVKIEISCRSLREPYEAIEMRSLIGDKYEAEDFADNYFTVNTVLPSRTFLEKVFLLHEEFQKQTVRSVRMSRHLYDLERLMDTPFAKDALNNPDLYLTILKHRYAFTKVSEADYKTHHPHTVSIIPPAHLLDDWRKDYDNMKESFIYGNSISFDQLISRLTELQNRFRKINLEDEFFDK